MILQKNKLVANFDQETPSIIIGAVIQINYDEQIIPLAHVFWNETNKSCYFSAIKDHFQTYIIDKDIFADFVYMLDELYYLISKEHGVNI